MFEYHGAEHKTISCYEAGLPLTPENAQRFSRLHPRCGTSFLLIVMIVAIFVFAPIGLPAWYWLVAVAHPRRAARRRHLLRDHPVGRPQPAQALGARGHVAGTQLQKLTTREPDLDQLAVAIAAHGRGARRRDSGRALHRGAVVGVEVVRLSRPR